MQKKVILTGILIFGLALNTGWSQDKLSTLKDFKEQQGTWLEAGDAKLNQDDDKKLAAIEGTGVLISELGKTANLVTKQN